MKEARAVTVVVALALAAGCYEDPSSSTAPANDPNAGGPLPCAGAACAADASADATTPLATDGATAPSTAPADGDAGSLSEACPGVDLTTAPHLATSAGALVAGGFGGRTALSRDGVRWSWSVSAPPAADASVLDNGILSIATSGSMLVAAAGSGVLSSADGVTWTPRPVPNVSQYVAYDNGFNAAAYGKGLFVVAASAKFNDLAFYHSSDGVTWTDAPFVVSGTCCRAINAIAFADGKFVGVGSGRRTIVSDDGITWHDDKLGAPDDGLAYRAVAFGNGVWVAAGVRSLLAWSTNGIDWTDATQPAAAGDFEAVAFDGSKFVTCSRWACYASDDGKTWTQSAGVSTDPRPTVSIVHEGGIFVGLDVPARVLTSTDGATWTPVLCGLPPELRALAFSPTL